MDVNTHCPLDYNLSLMFTDAAIAHGTLSGKGKWTTIQKVISENSLYVLYIDLSLYMSILTLYT